MKLDGVVGGTAVGGGGRYIVLHLNELSKLAVFDANTATIVQHVLLYSNDIAFTAGAEKLIVAHRDRKTIDRWDLRTFERELTKNIESEFPIANVVMGSASNGPILLTFGERFESARQLLDVDTLEASTVTLQGGARPSVGGGSDCVIRASADGRVFGMWGRRGSPSGLQTLVITGNHARYHYEHASVGDIYPSPDGRWLYAGRGIYTNELKAMTGDPQLAEMGAVPAVHGDFYMLPAERVEDGMSLHLVGERRPLAKFRDVQIPYQVVVEPDAAAAGRQRVYLIPDSRLLVSLPKSNDQLILRSFDMDKVLANCDVDYLFVSSRPVRHAERGSSYEYGLEVKSRRGGVRCQVAVGPPEMSVSNDGRVTWTPSAHYAGSTADVILSVRDSSGQEVFQDFSIHVSGEAVPTAAKNPGKQPGTNSTVEAKPSSEVKAPPAASAEVRTPRIDRLAIEGDRATVKLPGPFDAAAVAGGGRFLILHLSQLRQLAVFDICRAKVIKHLPLESNDVAFTAGADRIIVALRDKKRLERWSLRTFERELTANNPTPVGITNLAMGSASEGPVLASTDLRNGQSPLIFLDGRTLQVQSMRHSNLDVWNGHSFPERPPDPRFSANGRMLLLADRAYVVRGNFVEQKLAPDDEGPLPNHALPNVDGTTVYGFNATFSSEMRPIARPAGLPIPALQPGYYLMLSEIDPERAAARREQGRFSIHAEGQERPLVTLNIPIVSSVRALDSGDDYEFGLARRFYFLPDAQALVQLPISNDHLLVYRVDMDAELKKSAVDYLFVSSRPPTRAIPGKTYEYPLNVKSKRGGVKFKLATAPKGMKISSAGVVTWLVPADFSLERQDVVVLVIDASGQVASHAFSLSLPEVVAREESRLAAKAKLEQEVPKNLFALPESIDSVEGPVDAKDARRAAEAAALDILRRSLKNGAGVDDANFAKNPTAALKLIGLGFLAAQEKNRRIVPLYNADSGGKPLLSWRVHLLPYIGGKELYGLFRLDEPWDSPHNAQLADQMPNYYRAVGGPANAGLTNFLAVVGKHCFFNGSKVVSLAQATDGTRNTAAVVEAPNGLAVNWMKPDDFPLAGGESLRSLVGLRKGGFYALFLDGDVKLVSAENSAITLERIFTPRDGNPLELK